MQQVIQPIDGQATEVAEIPAPVCGPGQVLIANHFSLVSAGTERSTLALAKKSLLQKARARPDHVRRVLEKVRREGLGATIRQVRAKLDQPLALGYSSAGVVLEVGSAVREFQVGDRVASNGPHAGIVAVPKNLVARVPENVALEDAAYTVVGAIALQGTRLAGVGLGDVVGVIGLGLIGQLTIALLKSMGCRVYGTDPDPRKRDLALSMGADAVGESSTFVQLLTSATSGHGADAVLITAATSSNAPVELAATVARKKAKVVAVGAVGMDLPRREFYPKELDFVVSCSYGPGRYDSQYEDWGHDYPRAYVRWTEQRNLQAVLEQMAAGRLPTRTLTTHQFTIENALQAYQMIEAGKEPHVGILLSYSTTPNRTRTVEMPATKDSRPANTLVAPLSHAPETSTTSLGISVVGAGNFSSATLLPALLSSTRASDTATFRPTGILSATGLSARALARKYRFRYISTDFQEVLTDVSTDVVVVATRHDQHTSMGLATLQAGKRLFLEKPLAITEEELAQWREVITRLGADCPMWTVGFNRRYSPATQWLQQAFAAITDPKNISIRFNAGAIPADHWTQDPEIGGGRIIGEACHALDLACYLTGSPLVKVYAEAVSPRGAVSATEDNVTISAKHADGSVSTILYCAQGDRAAGKERVEMFAAGRAGFLEDFRQVTTFAHGRRQLHKTWWSQQKGYQEEVLAFRAALVSGTPPIPYAELFNVACAAIRAVQSIRLGLPLEVDG